MLIRNVCLYIYILFAAGLAVAQPQEVIDHSAHTFLIQDRWGVIIGATASLTQSVSETEIVRGMLEMPRSPEVVDLEVYRDGGFQLMVDGNMLPLGSARLPHTLWTPLAQCQALAIMPDWSGAWIASEDLVKVRGKPVQMVLPPTLGQGKRVTDLEYDPDTGRMAILFEHGGLSISYRNRFEQVSASYLEDDPAIDVEFYNEAYLILTESGKVFQVPSQGGSEIAEVPELGEGLARDLEVSPWGEGFYILDAFGTIHAHLGAPEVFSSPLAQDSAVDLEIVSLASPPEWYHPGLNTNAYLSPSQLQLDPVGSPRTVSLNIKNAEDVFGYIAELHYDPALIKVDSNQVVIGKWWEENIPNALVQASIESDEGIVYLSGGGSFLPFSGASGDGELARIAISAASDVNQASTTFNLTNFYFRDAFSSEQFRPAKSVNSASIVIKPFNPIITLKNYVQDATKTESIMPGDIVRIDLILENGSRVQGINFDISFSKDSLRYLGTSLGGGWSEGAKIHRRFAIPSESNSNGVLQNQKIQVINDYSLSDNKDTLAVMFFALISANEGYIRLNRIQLTDRQGRNLEPITNNTEWQF